LLQRDDIKKYELALSDYHLLQGECILRGVDFLCTAFDVDWLDKVVEMGVPYIKVPSSKITDMPYLKACDDYGIPIILSTGLSGIDEIYNALSVIHMGINPILMHCTTDYPCRPEDANMLALETLKGLFPELEIGYSDHTVGTLAGTMAVAMGAKYIEKHITMDTKQRGPDHSASANPAMFFEYVDSIREVEAMMGDGKKKVEKGAEEYLWVKAQYNLSN
jgi:sialic acid synthase SpsE